MPDRRRRQSSATTPMTARGSAPGESRLGGYSVLAQLARGGTSGVYLAEQVATGNRVALKVLDPIYAQHGEIVERLLAEHTVSARVCHAGLLDVIAADRSAHGVPYIVMEYLDGENLGALAERGEVALDAILAIAAQIASALAALHAGGVIHCDVKPDNVFVLYETGPRGWPRIKLIDYGVARRSEEGALPDAAIAGTPSYMPPEQWHGEPVYASDVYALGCLLYELIVGNPPFHGSLPRMMAQHCDRLADRVSAHRTVPAKLDNLVARMLSKEPGMRPAISEIEATLADLLEGEAKPLEAMVG
jgi:serine/threonine-protein kinase